MKFSSPFELLRYYLQPWGFEDYDSLAYIHARNVMFIRGKMKEAGFNYQIYPFPSVGFEDYQQIPFPQLTNKNKLL